MIRYPLQVVTCECPWEILPAGKQQPPLENLFHAVSHDVHFSDHAIHLETHLLPHEYDRTGHCVMAPQLFVNKFPKYSVGQLLPDI